MGSSSSSTASSSTQRSSAQAQAEPQLNREKTPVDAQRLREVEDKIARSQAERAELLARVQSEQDPTLGTLLNNYSDILGEPRLEGFVVLAQNANRQVADFFKYRAELKEAEPGFCKEMDALHRDYVDLLSRTLMAVRRAQMSSDFLFDNICLVVELLEDVRARIKRKDVSVAEPGALAAEEREIDEVLDEVRQWREASSLDNISAQWSAFRKRCEEVNTVWAQLKRGVKRVSRKTWKTLKRAFIGVTVLMAGAIVATVIIAASVGATPAAGAAVAIGIWEVAGTFIAANATAIGLGVAGCAAVGTAASLFCHRMDSEAAKRLALQADEVTKSLHEMMSMAAKMEDTSKGSLTPLIMELNVRIQGYEEKMSTQRGTYFIQKSIMGFKRIQEYLAKYQKAAEKVAQECETGLRDLAVRLK